MNNGGNSGPPAGYGVQDNSEETEKFLIAMLSKRR